MSLSSVSGVMISSFMIQQNTAKVQELSRSGLLLAYKEKVAIKLPVLTNRANFTVV